MAHQVLKLLQQKPQQCGAIKQLNLFNKYLLLVTFETDDNYSILFKMKKKHYVHSTSCWRSWQVSRVKDIRDELRYFLVWHLARVIVIATCPSVRPAVTRQYCVKTKKASVMISSPSGSPKTLVFWRQISWPNSKGFPPNGGLKQGSVGKIQRFFSFKRQYLETVADTAKVTISN